MRPGSHRAVQPLDFGPGISLWRTAGFFGSPLQYGYIAGQHVCLPLAMALLLWQNSKTKGWLFWGSVAAYCLVSISLITTFTRGAWLAMGVAHLTVAFIVARRLAGVLLGAGGAALAVMFLTVSTFRARVLTFFDPNYSSNSERWFLWKANFEMFKDYPILGIGYQENETRAGEYVARLGKPDAFTGHAHSNYIQMLAGTGITGFVTYLFLISFMLWLTWRLWKRLPQDLLWPRAIALAALGAQIQLHIGGFTECNFKAGATNHNFMVVWALVISLSVLEAKGLLRSDRLKIPTV
jgi:O-antigen ligase